MITPFRRGDAQRHLNDKECFKRGFVQGPEADMKRYHDLMRPYAFAKRSEWFEASLKAIKEINGEV